MFKPDLDNTLASAAAAANAAAPERLSSALDLT